MANQFFQFKQFTIQQEHCAMKVCTDASIFGAVVSHHLLEAIGLPQKQVTCLDIGTGTGLLSLMVAQENLFAQIDAVEIDEAAARQARENFDASPWKERLHLYNSDISNIKSDKQYDYIISNPPFYENDLLSADLAKNKAKHASALSLEQLAAAVDIHLNTTGDFCILLPYHRIDQFEKQMEFHTLFLKKKILIKQSLSHNYFRAILIFSRKETEVASSAIHIRESNNTYSDEFISLLKNYYLLL